MSIIHSEWASIIDKLIAKMPIKNDHICPHCKNDKISRTEKSCWKCGGSLK